MNIQGPKKLAFFLPNTFTALNMACGFVSIILAIRGNFYFAILFEYPLEAIPLKYGHSNPYDQKL